jgi:hypothetical protein
MSSAKRIAAGRLFNKTNRGRIEFSEAIQVVIQYGNFWLVEELNEAMVDTLARLGVEAVSRLDPG